MTNIKKIFGGLIIIAIAYFVLFVPETFEAFDEYLSFSEITGIGYLAILFGLMGVGMIFQGLSQQSI